MKYPANVQIPFKVKDINISNFQLLNTQIAETIKQELLSSFIQVGAKGIYHSGN